MILNFDKFKGKLKSESLDKEEAIELVSLITDMKPSLPSLVSNQSISKLIDNINYYTSEDGKYKISISFRESDVYHNDDGTITYGNFKSLYKVKIVKLEGEFKLCEVKEYVILTSNIITEVYPESKIIIKLDDKRVSENDFNSLEDNTTIENIKLVIRII